MELPPTLAQHIEQSSQQHLLRYWDELDESGRQVLVAELEHIDFALVERLAGATEVAGSVADRVARARAPQNLVTPPTDEESRNEQRRAVQAGQDLLRSGRVGAILVAGGQGTRLGFDRPKGLFPIGPLSNKTLYQLFAEQLVARGRQFGPPIPYFIMTSGATHAETVAFFEEHDFFGLLPENVYFFEQGTLPALELDSGRMLLDQKGRLSLSPDGHGGLVRALARHRLLEEMTLRGIDYLYYHQVDNPSAPHCDPAFLGWHVLRGADISTKVVRKVSPDERMGVVCDVDGAAQIIEYSDLTPEQARTTDASGQPIFWAGNTAMHVFNREFLERLTETNGELPFHIARKAVPYVDDSGQRIVPSQPNARKFEQFIFDALPLARNALVVEVERREEFNPVKNRDGADSPATARQALIDIHRRWLEAAGAVVERDVVVEISPLFALDAEEVAARLPADSRFAEDTHLEPHLGT
ncbi:MAG: UDPGP type 1 family protein [Planctomyces sp.]|nr:UDPGP type 1 family protein [Planctomyces sp.]